MVVKNRLRAAAPKPGKKLQVIGAGLPRTGTNSFCAAMSTLLDAPSYHVGVQTVLDENGEAAPKAWIRIMELWPPSNDQQKEEFMDLLAEQLDGYTCVADPPASLLVPELMELYPDAKVLCTTRDKERWADSMLAIAKLIIPFWIARTLYFWVPVLRWMPYLWDLLPVIFEARHGELATDKASAYRMYDRHHAWLREVVPAEKLFFVDVKDGWGPMAEALGVEAPEGVAFPRLNDGGDIEEMFKEFAVQGLLRWGMVIGGMAVVGGGLWWWL